MRKILVVEGDRRIRSQIKEALLEANYRVFEANDVEDTLEIFLKEKGIALVMIDVDLPVMEGWQLCRTIRQSSDVPIIMLTAKQSESDEIQGFEAGADDFITKPFSLLVLVARIQRILRRTKEGQDTSIIEAGAIRLNKLSYEVDIEGELLELSNKEFKLLEYFLENQGVMLSREKILSSVWEFDYYGDARTIDTHVKKLRRKMKEKRNYIKTIRGLGYKFEAEENLK